MKDPETKKDEKPQKDQLEDAELSSVVGGAYVSPASKKAFDPQPEPPGIVDRAQNIRQGR